MRSFDWLTAKYRVKTVARILSIQITILFLVYQLVSSKKVGHKKQVNPRRTSTRKIQTHSLSPMVEEIFFKKNGKLTPLLLVLVSVI